MIFSLLIIHNHDRMSSTTRVPSLHSTTWAYLTSRLPDKFCCSPNAVKEAILTDINDLVQELLETSSDVGASFLAMRRLLMILEKCSNYLEVCFYFRFRDSSSSSSSSST